MIAGNVRSAIMARMKMQYFELMTGLTGCAAAYQALVRDRNGPLTIAADRCLYNARILADRCSNAVTDKIT
ncbi:MAG: hypothetical protein COC12_00910 [Rhodobacteraceae bacterium]|nr:MAG: hypothetical protein COC12_00910 [Paracoccaceae bacterium]